MKGAGSIYYVHTDYLGSINFVTNAGGSTVQELSFDAWGRQRNATNWTYTSLPAPKFERGYTFHEHLAEFDLINMNGRMYDPVLGRFLSPDPFLQAPGNLQNYNRYSYVFNNPLKYTDPSGYKRMPIERVNSIKACSIEYGGLGGEGIPFWALDYGMIRYEAMWERYYSEIHYNPYTGRYEDRRGNTYTTQEVIEQVSQRYPGQVASFSGPNALANAQSYLNNGYSSSSNSRPYNVPTGFLKGLFNKLGIGVENSNGSSITLPGWLIGLFTISQSNFNFVSYTSSGVNSSFPNSFMIWNHSDYDIGIRPENGDDQPFVLKSGGSTSMRIDGFSHPAHPNEVYKVTTPITFLTDITITNEGFYFGGDEVPNTIDNWIFKTLNELGGGGWRTPSSFDWDYFKSTLDCN